MVAKVQEDLKQAQLARDGVKVSTLRLLLSEIKNGEIQKGSDLSEDEVVSIVGREIKKRKEAAHGFRSGDREEQAQKEEAELKVLETYLPAQLSNEQLTKIVEEAISEIGAKSITDMGRVMGVVMGRVKGQADGSSISLIVKERLSK